MKLSKKSIIVITLLLISMIMWLEANGIKNIKSTKYNAKYILKMVSLVKITIQWSFVGILIYSILIRIVDFTVGALHKKAI